MKKYITLCVDFPVNSEKLSSQEVADYVTASIENFSLETGKLAAVFDYESPEVYDIIVQDL